MYAVLLQVWRECQIETVLAHQGVRTILQQNLCGLHYSALPDVSILAKEPMHNSCRINLVRWCLRCLSTRVCYKMRGGVQDSALYCWSAIFSETVTLVCVTKRRSSWACIGNPNPEQETIKGTHAQETSAYQRRPTTQHAAQASKQPPNRGAIHAASEDTTHTSNNTTCHQGRKRRPARHPLWYVVLN